ncbi:peptide ABC transporter substrate-binding protein [Amycolatopsis saalfeldensis]|uniref:Peptide/nickel transport system substrate-binding protein n=1 Tax=Amycolatopsis saalfeldensis TaxID=394193 RepID=A0A1H8YP22_9PSEU|nr:peptide ABC transporter substrate-binding protein [Amycolatopsis saalfeldensis]SEP53128.1 peptide/nickel transport system substrate-binding protein [Amycolatopsis saalfeldensis]
MTTRITLTTGRRGFPGRTGLALAALATAAVTLTSACTSGGLRTTASGQPAAVVPVRQGGSIVIGAEQEPDCADWISTCAGSIWGTYIMDVPTMPRAFVTRKSGDGWAPVPSDVLAGEPTVTTAGNRQQVTYRINPAAVWSDKAPITSEDLKYTVEQVRDGKDVLDKTGYDHVTAVGTPDPKTAVVTFDSPYANWRALFSDTFGIFPSHLLAGKDRDAVMKDGYRFSGGPWQIESWKRGVSVTLVPNPNYWGGKPKLDKVTFQFTADTAAAFQAFKSGQLDALYPTPQLDSVDQITGGLPGANSAVDPASGNLEALWMNNGKFPFDSTAFRQAVSYAIDRKAIVTRLYGALGVTAPAQSFLTPIIAQYGGDDFSRYQLDLGKVTSLMQGAGWAKGADGIWAKNGQRAEFGIASLAGNKRRELTEQILQQQLKTAGFELTIANTTAAELFSKVTPPGDFQLGLWTLVDTFPQPSLGTSFSTGAIPAPANGNSGLNYSRISSPDLDRALTTLNSSLDQNARMQASKEADRLLARDAASLPIDAVPNVLL